MTSAEAGFGAIDDPPNISSRYPVRRSMSATPVFPDGELNQLAQTIATIFVQRGATLATAESCTGGWIAKTLTDVAGSSAWFECGVVTYSYEAKESLLGVRPEILELQGAVSRETVIEMVSGALARFGATVAVAVARIDGSTR